MRGIDYWVGGKTMMEMTAAHLMEKEVVAFEEGMNCHRLAETLFEGDYGRHPGGFGSIPIIDKARKLLGIVSEFDLLNALMKGRDLKTTEASEIMTRPAVSITPEMPVEEIIGLLQSRHLIRVPVVDSEWKLVGIVARRDILGCYIESTLGALPVF